MQKFFFHVDYLLDTVMDPEGSDCADLEAARIEARAIIRELAADYLATDRLFDPIDISIGDAAGKILAKVSVAEAVSECFPTDDQRPSRLNSG
ncbi:DUF6894 family protein [Paracoccus sp. (in: a-proteobacteria)]|uniref:DUF6894 family protein n=1 Tax=Paracoccus sp. TaxID=267 RepID=UPI00396CF8D7